MRTLCVTCLAFTLAFTSAIAAQSTTGGVPLIIPLAGDLKTPAGQPRTGTVLVVISLYAEKDDAAPLWVENQTVTLDASGRYSLQFGITQAEGLPSHFFDTGVAKWVGVAVENEPEQPRMMLVSVPYAAKAANADSLAGRDATEFVTTSTLKEKVRAAFEQPSSDGSTTQSVTLNYLQKGDGTGGTTDSSVVEVNGNVGLGTASPTTRLDMSGDFNIGASGRVMMASTAIFSLANGNTELRINPGGFPTVTLSGNIGLGTSSPSTKLHVIGDTTLGGNVSVSGNIAAKYQDVAEWVESTESMTPGTIVIIAPNAMNRVATSTHAYDIRIAGAISAKPGVVLGEPGEGKVLVAQSGRVRIKADARYGAIRVGDLLVTSPTSGYAMRSRPANVGGVLIHRPGTVLGKALEPLALGKGEILALLTLQ